MQMDRYLFALFEKRSIRRISSARPGRPMQNGNTAKHFLSHRHVGKQFSQQTATSFDPVEAILRKPFHKRNDRSQASKPARSRATGAALPPNE
jgi:hypothetical protein